MEVPRNKQSRIGVVGWLGIVTALLCIGGLYLLRAYGNSRLQRQYSMCRVFANNLAGAMKQYQAFFGEPPPGDADAILRVLSGQNREKFIFLDVSHTHGAIIDPWDTPYLIETNQTNGLSIRSAGPNRRFGDADDLEQSLVVDSLRQAPR